MVSAEHQFVVVGAGSAGRRHAMSLRSLFPTAPIVVVKRSSTFQPLDGLKQARIAVVDSIDEATRTAPTFCAIASPATLHLSDLEAMSKYCSRFLLEKPISADSSDARRIVELASSQGLKISIGHHLRFSETPRAFRNQVELQSMSHLETFYFGYGQHLRYWRPSVRPEQTVTARKELGGGVVRELSHEIDFAWLLGGPLHEVRCAELSHSGAPTDGLVETIADFTLVGENLDIDVHLDMTAEEPFRIWEAKFRDVVIRADLLNGTVSRIESNGLHEVVHRSGIDERDRAAKELIRAAIDIDDDNSRDSCDIHHGLRIINTIESVEESARSGTRAAIRE